MFPERPARPPHVLPDPAFVRDDEMTLGPALFRHLPDPAWIKGPDGHYLACNLAFEDIAGRSEADLQGLTDADLFSPADASFFRRHDLAAQQQDRPCTNEEWLVSVKTGDRRLYEVIKTPMRRPDGRLVGVLGVARDVTVIRLAEEKASALAESLDERTLQLDARLREMRCLCQVSAELGDFALTPVQATQVVLRCLPMAMIDGSHWLQASVSLGPVRVGDPVPATGWVLARDIVAGDRVIGEIGMSCRETLPAADLLESLARELARWHERQVAADLLHRSEAHLLATQRVAGLGHWRGDGSCDLLVLDAASCELLGLPQGQAMTSDEALALVADRDRARVQLQWQTALRGTSLVCEFRLAMPEAPPERWVRVVADITHRDDGSIASVTGTVMDITSRKQADERMRLAARIFESASESILVTDAQAHIVAVNTAFTRLSGYTQDEVLGLNPSLLKSGRQGVGFYERMWRVLSRQDTFQAEFWNRAKDGHIYPVRQTITALRDAEGQVTHYVGIGADLSQLRDAQERMLYLSSHDMLTGLPNRHSVNRQIRRVISAHLSELTAPSAVAVMVIGLDGFKSVNDSMGHTAGDEVLVAMGDRLRPLTAHGHCVGRLGGDEFVVLMMNADREHCLRTARQLLDSLARPLPVAGHELTMTVSIGISCYPADGNVSDVLLQNAESALYGAKHEGRNTVRFYDPQLNEASLDRLILMSALRRGIPAGELRAWYQPKIDLRTGRVTGAEALVRWQHPEQGWIMPARFIPAAEQSDLIKVIGAWMLEEVARQIACWHAQGHGWLPVAVNLGARHFADPDLPGQLIRLRGEHHLPPHVLELEITESTLMSVGVEPGTLLGDLRRAGVLLSIDDFGTGYSSLSYLKHLPVDTLKIDRSFVSNIERDSRDLSIGSTIVALAHGLGLKVVAEGVETQGQRDLLARLGCDQGQGYLYARPMPAADFEAWWRAWLCSPTSAPAR